MKHGMVDGNTARLRTSLGTFRVRVSHVGSQWWFTRGWKRFSDIHFIVATDAVEVRYVRGNLFDVHVYSGSGCVREFGDEDSEILSAG